MVPDISRGKLLSARAKFGKRIGLACLMCALASCLIPAIPPEPRPNLTRPTCATSIAVGPEDDELWVAGCQPLDHGPLGDNYAIFHRRNEVWARTPDRAAQIAMSPEGVLWRVDGHGAVFERNQTGVGWRRHEGVCATGIGVGAERRAWVVGCPRSFEVSFLDGSRWTSVPGATANQIAVSPEGIPWVISQDPVDAVRRWNGSGFDKVPGCGTRITVGSDGDAWMLGCKSAGARGNAVQHWVGDRWIEVLGLMAVAIAKGPGGSLWLVDAAGKISEFSTLHEGAQPTVTPR
jgi:hypothetical protein